MRKTVGLIAALALALPGVALAHGNGNHRNHGYNNGYNDGYAYDNGYRYNDGYRHNANYNDGPREWRGSDGRTYCRKSDGTVGLVVGGAAGALIGRGLDRGYNRATGTILGAAAGALLGRAVSQKRSCR
jgi:Glycine zipper 2TM domain